VSGCICVIEGRPLTWAFIFVGGCVSSLPLSRASLSLRALYC
jgi:hypothetical protein